MRGGRRQPPGQPEPVAAGAVVAGPLEERALESSAFMLDRIAKELSA
ncbi:MULTISPECIES: hypothetical protein [unclassified Streptomyces]